MKIKDVEVCSPIPGGDLGAVCDGFLVSNQQILTDAEWKALQASWIAQGQAVECTSSSTIAALKIELEELCSDENDCDYETQQMISKALDKMSTLGKVGLK